MALDKLVDSTQIDGAMTATANAIRGKTGHSSAIAWDLTNGFKSAVEAIPSGGNVNIQANKNATPSTGQQIIQPDSGYDALGQVTVNGISPTKAAQTYTPTTSNQVIQSGRWLSGDQTILGDSNLIAENIAEGISIFGVTGTHSGGGNTDIEDSIITRTISMMYENSRVTNIGDYAFARCYSLTSVSFPECTSIGSSAFASCSSLTSVSFPKCTSIWFAAFSYCSMLTSVSFPECTSIGDTAFFQCSGLTSVSFPECTSIGGNAFARCYSLTSASFPECTSIGIGAFMSCSSLTSVSFPKCTSIGSSAFASCPSLTEVDFPECKSIGSSAFFRCPSLTKASFSKCGYIGQYAFQSCYMLISLYLNSSSLVSLANIYALSSTPIGGYSISAGRYGSIYVPRSLLSSYKTAKNWSTYSSRFVGM